MKRKNTDRDRSGRGNAGITFEKDLRDLTEDYSLNADGTIKVVTQAYTR